MGEKLTRLEGSADDLKNASKQISLDVHVCKETVRQKLETMHGEQKHFVGATNSNFRGLNVLIPQFKHLGDQGKDMLDYLVRANQHDTSQAEATHTVMESTNNAEDRIVRVESLCSGLIDQINEINELMQQIREAQSLQQESLNTIVERTPKLPKRESTSRDTATRDTSGATTARDFVGDATASAPAGSCRQHDSNAATVRAFAALGSGDNQPDLHGQGPSKSGLHSRLAEGASWQRRYLILLFRMCRCQAGW